MSPEWKYLYLTCSDRTKRWAQAAVAAVSVVAVLGLVLATHLQPHNTLGQGEAPEYIPGLCNHVTLRPAVLPTVQLGDGVHEELQLHRGHGRHQGAGPVLQPAV